MSARKIMAMLLAAGCLTSSLTACGKKGDDQTSTGLKDPYEGKSFADISSDIYSKVLGDFYEIYEAAKEETNVSKRYALMAIAEAKLLETGVMLPTKGYGGNYAISRVAPYTTDYALWGSDDSRYHQAIVATEPIKTEDRAEMKEKWAELKGTGTYEAWAKSYLTEKGYTITDSYSLSYTSDPQTWDVLSTSLAADSEAIVNTYDGLMEYDVEGTLQPALATSYTVSDDGLTYTFTIRDGVKWVDSQQREYADVTAYDFVAGMQHMLDAAGGLEYLVEGIIVNASEYIAGTVTDFSEVGVKALDEHTLVYTLESPCTYFTTLLGYSVFAPLCESYYKSQGGKFGSEYDAAADGYTYGTDSDHILYCGPYVVTNATANNTIVFSANQTYWNKDNINVHTITWLFTDSSDPTKTYTDMQAGILSGCGLNSSALEIAKSDGWFDQYAYVTTPSMTTYVDYINLHRVAYANYNDETKVVSTMTDEQKIRTNLAVLNVHFRNALNFSVDRGLLNAQTVGDELKYVSVRNSYTPGNFVSLEEDTTVEINGVATTFAKGTYYGEIMQAQLTADGSTIQVWDSTANDGIGSGDGFDGWYNPTAAAEELAKAVEELAAEGVEISAENPIYIDYPYPSNVTAYVNQANAYKQSVESATGGKIVVNLVACADYLEWYYSGYYPSTGEGMNYTVSSVSGWGPDYGDPSTYLDTLLPDGAGYVTSSLGIY